MSRFYPHVLLGVVLGSMVGIVLRACLFACGTVVLAVSGAALEQAVALTPGADPVYTRAAVHSLVDAHLGGVAIVGPLGDALHAADPSVFASPLRARWLLVRVVLAPGSSVLSRLAVAAFAHAGVLAAGLLLLREGLQARRPVLVGMGLAAQTQVALGLLATPPALTDLDTIGLPFALNALLPWFGGRRLVVTDVAAAAPPAAVAAAIVAMALIVAYIAAAVAAVAAVAVVAARRRLRSDQRALHAVGRPTRRGAVGFSLGSTVSLVGLSAIAAACQAVPVVQAVPAPVPMTRLDADPANGTLSAAVDSLPQGQLSRRPASVRLTGGDRWFQQSVPSSHVEIAVTGGGFQYLVDGRAQVIQGMGLNTQYASQLSAAERRAKLDADFREMEALGINTVVGWDPAEFDGVLLEAAQQHNIGVVMPFDLRPDADYTDPVVRLELTHDVLAWVQRYRRYPALRMWGLGNEVLHKIVHPAWVGPQDPAQEQRAVAFSNWLVETADAIHTADPDHPVTYRDAEDAFVSWVADAVHQHPAPTRTWFVWGTNCYQDYLGSLADNWPEQGTGMALWVSEFAPGGLAIPDRPAGFEQMWADVRRHPDWVLGGAVYAWTRNGPEEIDRNLGLTDDGQPVDGRSLDAIAGFFGAAQTT